MLKSGAKLGILFLIAKHFRFISLFHALSFFRMDFFALFCSYKTRKIDIIKTNYIHIMKKYLGILLIVLGAVLLLLIYLLDWVDNNVALFSSLGLMIVGLIAHILIQKRL